MDSELLGGDVAFDLAEFLFKSHETGLNRLLLGHRRSEQRLQQALIGNSGFLGMSLLGTKVGCVKMNGDSHSAFLSERVANEFSASSVDLEMAKGWLFHDRASETFSIQRNR